jgi:hypothetical protein
VTFTLRLTEDRLGAGARLSLAATPRVLYTPERGAILCSGAATLGVAVDTSLLRFELLSASEPSVSIIGKVDSRHVLEHAMELHPARAG